MMPPILARSEFRTSLYTSETGCVRLEARFRDRGPSPEEVNDAFRRLAESPRAKLYGKPVDEH